MFDLFDPLGILRAASAINQYRIHSGYHYPRSPETIRETLEARAEFLNTFAPAIVRNSRHYYAIPHEGSQTPPALFEKVMAEFHLSVRPCRPEWMDFGFIDKCYEVDEQIYDPDILRDMLSSRIQALNIPFDQRAFTPDMRSEYDYVVWATYGLGPGRGLFKGVKYQVAEKILIQLPRELQGISLVVVDGPFTAFDPYGSSPRSLFGSAKNTNHWTTTNPDEPIPEIYQPLLNRPDFEPFAATRFEAMRTRFRSRRPGIEGRGLPWFALHHSRGGRQSSPGPKDAVHPGAGKGRNFRLFRQGGQRREGCPPGHRANHGRREVVGFRSTFSNSNRAGLNCE